MLIVWIAALFYITEIRSETLCPREVVDLGWSRFVWPSKKSDEENSFTLSRPACYDENSRIIVRRCFNKSWIPESPPTCLPGKTNKFCPEHLLEVIVKSHFICIKMSALQPWTEEFCYGSDKTLFELSTDERRIILLDIVNVYNTTRFWVPAARYPGEGMYNPVVWRLPGPEWGELMQQRFNELSPERCVSARVGFNSEITLELVNCDLLLPNICFLKKTLVVPSVCPDLHAAMSYNPTVCYGIKRVNELDNYSAFDYSRLLHEDNIFQLIFENLNVKKQICFLKRHEGSPPFLGINPDKMEICLVNNANCRLSDVFLKDKKTVQMYLTFNAARNTLILTVYNRKFIWREDRKDWGIKCFTNANHDLISTAKIKDLIWEDESERKSLFEVKLYGDVPGYYWCEAHSIYDFEFIKTPTIVATKKRKRHSFAFIFAIPYSVEDSDHFNKNMKHYEKIVEKILNDIKHSHSNRRIFRTIVIHNVRIMSIEKLVPNVNIQFLCHASVTLKLSSGDKSSEEDTNEDYDGSDNSELINDATAASKLRELLRRLLKMYSRRDVPVNSTEFCLSDPLSRDSLQWRPAKLATTSTSFDFCLKSNGLPITRRCLGNFLLGGWWEPLKSQIECIKTFKEDVITTNLYEIERSNAAKYDPVNIVSYLNELVNSTRKFIPADFFYLGRIMQAIASTISTNALKDTTNLTEHSVKFDRDTLDILNIYNNLLEADTRTAKLSAVLNSTNSLLDAFESIIDELSLLEITSTGSNYSEDVQDDERNVLFIDGVNLQISKRLLVFTADPGFANASGVALYFKNSNFSDFTKADIKVLFSNQSIDDLLLEQDLEIATFVPQSLLDRLGEIQIPNNETSPFPDEKLSTKIIIKIYINDNLFQENLQISNRKVFSKVISISIPGYERNLPEPLPILIKSEFTDDNHQNVSKCSYWNYSTWADDGIDLKETSPVNGNISLYETSHLTPFAYLIAGSYNLSVSADVVVITTLHEEALDIITLLGCSLSLIGIVGIMITAITFQAWREKPTSKVLLHLSVAIALQMTLFCFVNTDVLTTHLLKNHIYSSCIILGASLHYSVLVQFSWMLIVAFLQYKRYVKVIGKSRPTRFFLKSFLLGWILPLIPVACVILINREAYVPMYNPDNSKICYPSGQALYLGVVLPIASIIFANLVIYFLVIYHITFGQNNNIRQTERKLAVAHLRVSILLFFLLGFTWIFGLLAAMKAGLLFSYIFCLTATMQGFVLFIYFVVLDPVTRKLWSNYLTNVLCRKNKKINL